MNGPGTGIEKILRKFRAAVLPMLCAFNPEVKKADLDWWLWSNNKYPAAFKALTKHRQFRNRVMADAYICGYYRGLRDACYELKVGK